MSHPEPSCVDFRLLASDLSAGCLWGSSAPTQARVHRSFRSRRSGENGKGPEIDCRGIWRRYFISCDKQDIEWSCREIVEVMVDYNHSLGNTIDLPEIHAHLMLNAFLQQEAQGVGDRLGFAFNSLPRPPPPL